MSTKTKQINTQSIIREKFEEIIKWFDENGVEVHAFKIEEDVKAGRKEYVLRVGEDLEGVPE